MTDRLIVNNITLDLNDEQIIPITYSIADFTEPNSRPRTFSASIDLPGTANNLKFFAENYDFHSWGDMMNFNPLSRASAVYLRNGIEVIKDAVLKLNKVTITDDEIVFNTQLYSTTVDSFLILEKLNINDLDFSDLEHNLTRANIIASWSTPDGVGYRYPMMIYRELTAPMTWNNRDLIPMIHVYELITRIFNHIEFKWESNFFESERFKKLLYGFGGGDYINKSLTITEIEARRVTLTDGDIDHVIAVQWQGASEDQSIISYPQYQIPKLWLNNSILSVVEVTDGYNQYTLGQFNIAFSGNYSLSIIGELLFEAWINYYTGPFGIGLGRFIIDINGVEVAQLNFSGSDVQNIPFNNPTVLEPLNIIHNLFLNQNDVVRLYVEPKLMQVAGVTWQDMAGAYQRISTPTPLEIDLQVIDAEVTDNSIITMGKMLPSMTCKEFLNGIFNMFNLFISEPDTITGISKIEPFEDFYNYSISSYWDISSIIDLSKQIEIKPTGNELSGYINYKFRESDERGHKNYEVRNSKRYGDRTIINHSFYSVSTDDNELPFGCINPENYNNTMLIPVYLNEAGEQNKGVPKICFWNGLKNCDNWILKDINTASQNILNQYPSIHHLDNHEDPTFDLNYIGELINTIGPDQIEYNIPNLYTEYIEASLNEMLDKHGKYISCYIYITEREIYERNLSHLAVIEGVLFRIQIIGEFDGKSGKTTKIELLKVIK